MLRLPDRVLWYGRDTPPPATRLLRAGPVTALLDGADLRYVRAGGREIVRRLYVAVRDPNWGTLPADISPIDVTQGADHFALRFTVRHTAGEIDFAWQGEVTGSPDGTITYVMDGRAATTFSYNRIGICALHPPETSAARPYQAHTPDGLQEGVLPDLIGPQLIVDDVVQALFPAFDRLTIALAERATVDFRFEGDLFEMEDQRNWTDASFKTYSTPLARPLPHTAQAGQAIRQAVTIATTGLAASGVAEPQSIQVRVGPGLGRSMPPIGFGMSSHDAPLTEREAAQLRPLQAAHLRVDLTFSDPDWSSALERARHAAGLLGCPLELALFLAGETEAAAPRMSALAVALRDVTVARIAVFVVPARVGQARSVASAPLAAWLALARDHLGPVVGDVPFGAGSNANFTELNRLPPDPALIDVLMYALNPQVHAFDERSLVETLLAQGETVRSAQALSDGRPVVVSPVTLKPRANAVATRPEAEPPPNALPAAVDVRQMSLFAAGWTVGSLAALARAGVASLTYYETTGWRGIMETDSGSPPAFPSQPGMVFPLYHVFADVAEWRTGEVLGMVSNTPLRVAALGIRDDNGTHLLVANLTPDEQRVTLTDVEPGPVAQRRLTAAQADDALLAPARYRASTQVVSTSSQTQVTVTLSPFEVLRIDAGAGQAGPRPSRPE